MKIFIIDKGRLFVDGLCTLLQRLPGYDVVAVSNDCHLVNETIADKACDLLIMDLTLPDTDCISVIHSVLDAHPQVKILVLTNYFNTKIIKDLFKKGILGYLEKSSDFGEFRNALEVIEGGEPYIGVATKEKMMTAFLRPRSQYTRQNEVLLSTLTQREREIMHQVCEGNSSREISEKLFISRNTVETHKKNIYQKLNVRNSLGLMKFAYENNLLSAVE